MQLKPIEYEEGMVIEAGKYYLNMPNENYHAHKSISKSGLDKFEIDPYKFYNAKPMKQTRAMQMGSAIHAAVLEPEVFDAEFMMLPEIKDRRQAEYKAAVKSFGEGNVFTNAECEKIKGMQKAVWAHDEARRLLKAQGYCEISGFARDNETGIICRHRFDKLAKLDEGWWGVDLKKTQDVREFKFSRTISDYRYHVQDAFYSDQFEWITGEKLAGFKFIAVEEEYPHKVAVYELCDISKQIGKEAYRHNLNMYAEYESGAIKAHNNSGSEVISLPEYVLRQFEEEVI
ncbi:putative exodeoxyribonuclease 8 [Vibrio phage 1.291.O._10N.286.55.F6]|nr:putative exodeoxyribonuclease 8 [Vibrio phage 1.291.O._10N.286.55.F6]